MEKQIPTPRNVPESTNSKFKRLNEILDSDNDRLRGGRQNLNQTQNQSGQDPNRSTDSIGNKNLSLSQEFQGYQPLQKEEVKFQRFNSMSGGNANQSINNNILQKLETLSVKNQFNSNTHQHFGEGPGTYGMKSIPLNEILLDRRKNEMQLRNNAPTPLSSQRRDTNDPYFSSQQRTLDNNYPPILLQESVIRNDQNSLPQSIYQFLANQQQIRYGSEPKQVSSAHIPQDYQIDSRVYSRVNVGQQSKYLHAYLPNSQTLGTKQTFEYNQNPGILEAIQQRTNTKYLESRQMSIPDAYSNLKMEELSKNNYSQRNSPNHRLNTNAIQLPNIDNRKNYGNSTAVLDYYNQIINASGPNIDHGVDEGKYSPNHFYSSSGMNYVPESQTKFQLIKYDDQDYEVADYLKTINTYGKKDSPYKNYSKKRFNSQYTEEPSLLEENSLSNRGREKEVQGSPMYEIKKNSKIMMTNENEKVNNDYSKYATHSIYQRLQFIDSEAYSPSVNENFNFNNMNNSYRQPDYSDRRVTTQQGAIVDPQPMSRYNSQKTSSILNDSTLRREYNTGSMYSPINNSSQSIKREPTFKTVENDIGSQMYTNSDKKDIRVQETAPDAKAIQKLLQDENEALRLEQKQIQLERDLIKLELSIYQQEVEKMQERQKEQTSSMNDNEKLKKLENQLIDLKREKENTQSQLKQEYEKSKVLSQSQNQKGKPKTPKVQNNPIQPELIVIDSNQNISKNQGNLNNSMVSNTLTNSSIINNNSVDLANQTQNQQPEAQPIKMNQNTASQSKQFVSQIQEQNKQQPPPSVPEPVAKKAEPGNVIPSKYNFDEPVNPPKQKQKEIVIQQPVEKNAAEPVVVPSNKESQPKNEVPVIKVNDQEIQNPFVEQQESNPAQQLPPPPPPQQIPPGPIEQKQSIKSQNIDTHTYLDEFYAQFQEFYENELQNRHERLLDQFKQDPLDPDEKKRKEEEQKQFNNLTVFEDEDNLIKPIDSADDWVEDFQFGTEYISMENQFTSMMLFGTRKKPLSSQIDCPIIQGVSEIVDWELTQLSSPSRPEINAFMQAEDRVDALSKPIYVIGGNDNFTKVVFCFYSVPSDSKKLNNIIQDLHVINWFNQRKNINNVPTLRLLNSTTPLAFYPENPDFWRIGVELEMFINFNDIIESRVKNGNAIYQQEELLYIFGNLLKILTQFLRKNLSHNNISLKTMCYCPQTNKYKFIDFSKMSHNREFKFPLPSNFQPYFDPYMSPEMKLVYSDPSQPKPPAQKFDLSNQDMYALGMAFFFIKYLIPQEQRLRPQDYLANMKTLEADTKSVSSQIISQLLNKDIPKRKVLSYEDILNKKIKGKPMVIPKETDFIIDNFEKQISVEDRTNQSQIFADFYYQTYQVDNGLMEYRMLLFLQLETLKDKFNNRILKNLYRVIRCLLPLKQYQQLLNATEQYLYISKTMKLPVSLELSQVHNHSGQAKWQIGNRNEAIEQFMEAIEIQSLLLGKSHKQVVKGYNNVGVYYSNLGNTDKAIECLHQSIEFSKQSNDQNLDIEKSSLYNLGNLYLQKKDNVNALKYLEQCYTLIETTQVSNPIDLPMLCHNLGSIYYVNQDKDKTLKYLKQCVSVSQTKINVYDKQFLKYLKSYSLACYNFDHQHEAYLNIQGYSQKLSADLPKKSNEVQSNIMNIYRSLCSCVQVYTKIDQSKDALALIQFISSSCQTDQRLDQQQKDSIINALEDINSKIELEGSSKQQGSDVSVIQPNGGGSAPSVNPQSSSIAPAASSNNNNNQAFVAQV